MPDLASSLPGLLGPSSYDHAGIVVRDFDAGLQALHASLGVEWSDRVDTQTTVCFEDGPRQIDISHAFSTTFPLYELVSAVDDTIFDLPAGGIVHHLSYFTEDVAAASRHLTSLGYPLAMNTNAEGDLDRARLVMHRSPFGPFIEVIGYRPTTLYDGASGG